LERDTRDYKLTNPQSVILASEIAVSRKHRDASLAGMDNDYMSVLSYWPAQQFDCWHHSALHLFGSVALPDQFYTN